jgi:hypothetical protein
MGRNTRRIAEQALYTASSRLDEGPTGAIKKGGPSQPALCFACMKTLPDIAPQGQALSVASCIRYLKCNGWAQPDADTLVRLPLKKEAK